MTAMLVRPADLRDDDQPSETEDTPLEIPSIETLPDVSEESGDDESDAPVIPNQPTPKIAEYTAAKYSTYLDFTTEYVTTGVDTAWQAWDPACASLNPGDVVTVTREGKEPVQITLTLTPQVEAMTKTFEQVNGTLSTVLKSLSTMTMSISAEAVAQFTDVPKGLITTSPRAIPRTLDDIHVPVDQNVMALWCDALESGQYEQTSGKLRSDSAYCAWGVLCAVAVTMGVTTEQVLVGEGVGSLYSYHAYGSGNMITAPPPEVTRWLMPNVLAWDRLTLVNRVVMLNDHHGLSFAELGRELRRRFLNPVAA